MATNLKIMMTAFYDVRSLKRLLIYHHQAFHLDIGWLCFGWNEISANSDQQDGCRIQIFVNYYLRSATKPFILLLLDYTFDI